MALVAQEGDIQGAGTGARVLGRVLGEEEKSKGPDQHHRVLVRAYPSQVLFLSQKVCFVYKPLPCLPACGS